MARYVVLHFEDNEQAEEFVEEARISLDVRALVPAPTEFCHCGSLGGLIGWTKGAKFGWWVCSDCKRPGTRWGKAYRAVIAASVNLLEGKDQEREPVQGWNQ